MASVAGDRPSHARVADLDVILAERAVHSVYQPIVDLARDEVVAYEALARGPDGTPWSSPQTMLDAAQAVGRLDELDWVCRAAAFRGAFAAGLPPTLPLFVNIEPAAARAECPPDLAPVLAQAEERLRLVAEVTERSVSHDTAGLLAALQDWRSDDNRMALDDVGADAESQAMMPLLRPDIIKLDRTVTRDLTTPHAQRVVDAARAEAAHTGALILAEGIETPEQLTAVRAVGAALGQGWLLGRPGALPARLAPPPVALPPGRPARHAPAGTTPFGVASAQRRVEQASRVAMLRLSRTLEDRGVGATEPALILTSFQDARRLDGHTRRRYAEIAAEGVVTAAFGRDMPPRPAGRVRGCAVPAGDPLSDEWTVIVVSSRFAGGVFGRERDTDTYDVVTSEDRDLVLSAAATLARRLPPLRT
ncbi:EAL domain-containing protein [Asanoa sp. WMMD1127]|uniref:sensor domain-containing phosphodiesterase n=1 Tax=Asanoa sp. WMMD1127 TaxID=3016107 RepID=UPI002415F6CE|nr:EAL domain-containing protein [Asanoa sp. WMMD1127]MDG4824720.1 EAL domain-containing protein [Asanoa sp. WMMD1127]